MVEDPARQDDPQGSADLATSKAAQDATAELRADTKERPPAALVEEPAASETWISQETAADIYEGRLKAIWAVTHGGLHPDPIGEEGIGWQIVRSSVMAARRQILASEEELAFLSPIRTDEGQAGLSGDAETVLLLVSEAVERMEPADLPSYVPQVIAPTVDRLESDMQTSREDIVDIIQRPLSGLRGMLSTANLAELLFSYLLAEESAHWSRGFYTTVTQLGQLTGRFDRESRLKGCIIFHHSLRAAWRAAVRGELDSLDRRTRELISKTAANLAVLLWWLIDNDSEPGRATVRDLKIISATAVEQAEIPKDRAAAILEVLGFESSVSSAEDVLSILGDLGTIADPWTNDPVDLARLEAFGAVAAAVTGNSDTVALRLRHSAISLSDERQLNARMALAALGLRWALSTADSLEQAMFEFSGLDCIFTFLNAASLDEAANHEPEQWEAIKNLGGLLAGRVSRLSPASPEDEITIAKASRAVRELGVVPADHVDLREILATTNEAVVALRGQGGTSVPRSTDPTADLVLDTAHHAASVLTEAANGSTWNLAPLVLELVTRRDRPLDTLVECYRRFGEPIDEPLGVGPLVAAEVLDESKWRQLNADLRRRIDSIVPALEEFAS
jgi:hypothetical protein